MIGSASIRVIITIKNDLSPESLFIDKVLKSLLERGGFDLRDIATRLIAHGWYHDPEMSDTKMSWEELGDDLFSSSR